MPTLPPRLSELSSPFSEVTVLSGRKVRVADPHKKYSHTKRTDLFVSGSFVCEKHPGEEITFYYAVHRDLLCDVCYLE